MPRRLFYTFGNHMHWVDMQWLWGYHVLPGSVRDMLRIVSEAGVKGCVNFDGVGYEKMAAEAPESLAALKAAVQSGDIEPVGCSYGQPYGLFHGGESNIRHRVYGVRVVERLLGVRPKTFWEEEFDFFPQLPQVLKGCGFENASLYFQWTWHTPEIPKEDVPIVWWEGQDGTRLLTATRNRYNLHQWPEDMDILLQELATEEADETGPETLILQWLELMPSPDWMCRAELIMPKMKELMSDPRFEVETGTLCQYLDRHRNREHPVRRYVMDDVWHGMALGKNNDRMRRLSAQVERLLLSTESLAAINGLFGRPYAQWDVYPTWELEEAWRELLQAQHHDNDECEGLCGRVGRASYDKAKALTVGVGRLNSQLLERRMPGEPGQSILLNSLGWDRKVRMKDKESQEASLIEVPALGYVVMGSNLTIYSEEFDDPMQEDFSQGWTEQGIEWLVPGKPLVEFSMRSGGKEVLIQPNEQESWPNIKLTVRDRQVLGGKLIDVAVGFWHPPRPDPGMNAGLKMKFSLNWSPTRIVVDQPYGISEVRGSKGVKKYPEGDWMTSPQWFETIENAFSSLSIVDLVDDEGKGMLIVHDGSQQWFHHDGGVECLLSMDDPWDEGEVSYMGFGKFLLLPHAPIDNAQRWRTAQEFLSPGGTLTAKGGGDLPPTFQPIRCDSPSATITALYREAHGTSEHMEYPYVLRLAEWNGQESPTKLTFAGEVASVYKTNFLGERRAELAVTREGENSVVQLGMKPYEIATLYVDWVPGRKQTRDLDAKREIWATVHRTGE